MCYKLSSGPQLYAETVQPACVTGTSPVYCVICSSLYDFPPICPCFSLGMWACEIHHVVVEQWLFVSVLMLCSTSDVYYYVSVVPGINAGTTATVALLRDGIELVVASVGDSRAMLCRKGKALKLTVDHTPERKDEKDRYISAAFYFFLGSLLH